MALIARMMPCGISTNACRWSINRLSTSVAKAYRPAMQLALQPPPPVAFDRRNANLLLALIFWAFTYALFTYRANLRYGDAYELFSTVRLVPTIIGAGLYWLVLSKLIDGGRDRPGKPIAVVATMLPASIVVLLARVVLDQLGVNNPNGFAGDLRFVMVWGGYFGLWVSASFLLRTMPGGIVEDRHGFPSAVQRRAEWRAATAQVSASEQINPVDRLAVEIAGLAELDRRALLERFAMPGDYETADEFEYRPHC